MPSNSSPSYGTIRNCPVIIIIIILLFLLVSLIMQVLYSFYYFIIIQTFVLNAPINEEHHIGVRGAQCESVKLKQASFQ